ncbi:MAG TPA: DHA2 family efflux MFS transporter permease subunit [Solirubrobacteraceae bacterium]|nr:DHA2 family efflux MFS transporter permease subunit [Solirubrobacteraceae bacterium]
MRLEPGLRDRGAGLETPRRRRPGQRLAVGVVFVTGGFVTIMDGTIVNVALPRIGRDLGVAPTAVAAISIGYMVAMGAVVPVSGWLADRLGTRRVLLGALLLFTLTSALCGLAGSLGELVGLRIVQGLAGGTLAPVGLAMLYQTFPPQERVRVSAYTMIPTLLAPATGPILGGALVSELSWRFVFFVNVPIGLAGAIFGLLFVAETEPEEHVAGFDLAGFVISALAIGLLMLGLAEGPDLGWSDPVVLFGAAGGAVLLVLTIVVELRVNRPLLALRLLADRNFRAGSGIVATSGAAFAGTLFAIALYFQYGRGLSPLQSGLSTFPEAVGVLCGGQLSSRVLLAAVGPRRLITAGALGSTLTMALLATMGAHTSLWWARGIMFGVGLSTGLIFVATQVTAFAGIGSAATGAASTLFTVVRQVTGALGVALLTAVVGIVGATHVVGGQRAADLAAYRWPFVAAACLALCGAACARALTE